MLVLDPYVAAVQNLPAPALALGIAVVTATALLAQRSRSANPKSRKIHSLDSKIPIFGDMLEAAKHSDGRHDWFSDTCLRFQNEPWQLNIPGNPTVVVISDPALVEAVFVKHHDVFTKGEASQELMHDLFGDGILNSIGERWYHQRKTASKFFTARVLRQCMMQTMQRNVHLVYDVLDAECGTGRFANLNSLFNQFALQTFLEVGVGIDAPLIGKPNHPSLDALDDAAAMIIDRRLLPTMVWKIKRWFNVGSESKIKENVDSVSMYVKHLIDQALSNDKGNATDQKIRTAVELFVEHSAEDKVGLRPRDLVDFVLNFVIASRDSSSVATSWLFYELGRNPRVEAKIRAELAAKLPSLGVARDGYITADHVKQLVYLDAVIKETLRLNPAAPFTSRDAVEDIVIDGDLFIRKGQSLLVSMYAMARNPRVWGPDAAEFKPERWIDAATGELISVSASKFITFGAGPHQCIGMKLAMLNLRVLTANLLHRYKFEVDLSNDGSHLDSIVLVMKHPVLTKVERV